MKDKKKKELKKPKKLNYKLMGILYAVCAVIWLISAILNYNFESSRFIYILDIVCSVIWTLAAIYYFKKHKKEKNKK